MNATLENALRQIVCYRPSGMFAHPIDGYIYQWWLKDVTVETLRDLARQGYVERRPRTKKMGFTAITSHLLKADYSVRPTDKGNQYGRDMGWDVTVTEIERLQKIKSSEMLMSSAKATVYVNQLHEYALKEELKAPMLEQRYAMQQFTINTVEDLTYQWLYGSELIPGHIVYNEGYGTWDIVLEAKGDTLLVRSYDRAERKVRGFTRKECIVSTAEYKLLFNEPFDYMLIDWRGHRVGWSKNAVTL